MRRMQLQIDSDSYASGVQSDISSSSSSSQNFGKNRPKQQSNRNYTNPKPKCSSLQKQLPNQYLSQQRPPARTNRQTNQRLPPPQPTVDTYNNFLNPKSAQHHLFVNFIFTMGFLALQANPNILKNMRKLAQFIQSDKSTCFLFGPNGCGKRTITQKILNLNQIPYETIEEHFQEYQTDKMIQEDNYDDDSRFVSLQKTIIQTLDIPYVQNKIYLCYDFPIQGYQNSYDEEKKYKSDRKMFKEEFIGKVQRSKQKIIFILNSTIYNSFYVLNQNKKGQKSIYGDGGKGDNRNNGGRKQPQMFTDNPNGKKNYQQHTGTRSNQFQISESTIRHQNLQFHPRIYTFTMSSFNKTEIKNILKNHIEKHKFYKYEPYVKDAKFMMELAQDANGDARKALNLIYKKHLEVTASKNNDFYERRKHKKKNKKKEDNFYGGEDQYDGYGGMIKFVPPSKSEMVKMNETKEGLLGKGGSYKQNTKMQVQKDKFYPPQTIIQKMSNLEINSFNNSYKPPFKTHPMPSNLHDNTIYEHKIPQQLNKLDLFHSLGKLLYAKRLNIKTANPKKTEISCYYTEKQLAEYNPPLYFNPVTIFESSQTPWILYLALLHQNYVDRYTKIQDVVRLCKVFVYADSLTSIREDFDDDTIYQCRVAMICYGMVNCNWNSKQNEKGAGGKFGGGAHAFRRSKMADVSRIVKEKKRMLKKFYPTRYLSFTISFAHQHRYLIPEEPSVRIIFLNESNYGHSSFSQQKTSLSTNNYNKLEEKQENELNENNTLEKLYELEKKLKMEIQEKQKREKELESLFNGNEEDEEEDKYTDPDSSSSESDTEQMYRAKILKYSLKKAQEESKGNFSGTKLPKQKEINSKVDQKIEHYEKKLHEKSMSKMKEEKVQFRQQLLLDLLASDSEDQQEQVQGKKEQKIVVGRERNEEKGGIFEGRENRNFFQENNKLQVEEDQQVRKQSLLDIISLDDSD